MKNKVFYVVTVLLMVMASVFLTNFLLFADERAEQVVTVTAIVRPLRIIVVDDNLTIRKISSNTPEDVRPMVVKNEFDGEEVPFSESIVRQYEFLKPSLNFSKAGLVYQQDDRPVQAIIKRGISTTGKFFQLPF